jgi:hypothetical protein
MRDKEIQLPFFEHSHRERERERENDNYHFGKNGLGITNKIRDKVLFGTIMKIWDLMLHI